MDERDTWNPGLEVESVGATKESMYLGRRVSRNVFVGNNSHRYPFCWLSACSTTFSGRNQIGKKNGTKSLSTPISGQSLFDAHNSSRCPESSYARRCSARRFDHFQRQDTRSVADQELGELVQMRRS